ncbi:MerC domain-containing protein [Pelagicoccus sp. SDUM812003]|uniref:MerC domain-containing protein n=1 Tax=Pelagicoccus sp. SDUM812003 TaxID=3041267 RepID=UPI0028105E17|nr:MerC domain-containing protein [Pelagicoccus sp. SDUM812003]MDQ8202100.1 MerC domain-containing protein [Pelagicoccus sp. SDUM812003]
MRESEEIGDNKTWDLLGISLSVLCAIHCLSVPLLIGILPLIGLDFVADHEFEWVMMGIIFLVATWGYWRGYLRHRRKQIFWFLLLGVAIFACVRPFLSEEFHPVATLAGGLVFVMGHWKNWHWHRPSCRRSCCSHG